MPTYEYRCPAGHEFAKFYRKISGAASELPCPECGQAAERQVSGGAGLVFKGSGFYLTDYGKNAHRKPAPAAKTGGEGVGAAKESKADAAAGAGGESTRGEVKPNERAAGSKGGESKSGETKSTRGTPAGGSKKGGE